MKGLFKHGKTRDHGLVKNPAELFTLFSLANLVLARRFLGPALVRLTS
jgi:transposase, IS5 family